jgi:hypothetical protein
MTSYADSDLSAQTGPDFNPIWHVTLYIEYPTLGQVVKIWLIRDKHSGSDRKDPDDPDPAESGS